MKQVKKRFVISLIVIAVVLAVAAAVAKTGAEGLIAVEENMKEPIETALKVEWAAGVAVFVLWFVIYINNLKRAINPGTEPSHKFLWGAVTAVVTAIPCMLFMGGGGVCMDAICYGAGYALFAGISTAAAAAYTEF